MSKLVIRSIFQPGPPDQGMLFPEESITQQHFFGETDINAIMARFEESGVTPRIATSVKGVYADVSGVGSYQHALEVLEEADDLFDSLPSGLRARFHNSPHELMEFVGNSANQAEAVKLGLALPPKQPVGVFGPPQPVPTGVAPAVPKASEVPSAQVPT